MLDSQFRFSDPLVRSLGAFYERHGSRLPVLASVMFVLLLGRALADLVWALAPSPESARWQPSPATHAETRANTTVDINAIVAAQLFGRYEAAAPADAALQSAPETPLNLTLVGLLADDRDVYSRALIATQDGEENGYAIGDDVARGVSLQAIFPDRVVLSRDGRLETLSLDKNKPSTGDSGYAAPAVAGEASPETSAAQQLARIREEVLQDPAKASEYVRVQPANVGGQLRGYRVYPGRDRSVFSNAGLRPGDLVTAVNGVQLDDPAKALQLLGDLSQAGQLNLVIERGGQAQNISVNLN